MLSFNKGKKYGAGPTEMNSNPKLMKLYVLVSCIHREFVSSLRHLLVSRDGFNYEEHVQFWWKSQRGLRMRIVVGISSPPSAHNFHFEYMRSPFIRNRKTICIVKILNSIYNYKDHPCPPHLFQLKKLY